MKRIFLTLTAVLFAMSMQAQLKIGATGGVPTGDPADFYTFDFGADIYYYFLGADDELLNIGATAGYQHFVGDDITIGNITETFPAAQFLPLAGAARINLLKLLEFGPDIGYALGLNDGNDGGFYWRFSAGLDFGTFELNAFFYNVSIETANQGSLGIGLLYDFEGN